MTEKEILAAMVGKTIASICRGDGSCSNYTLFVRFTDGSGVNIGHTPGDVLYPHNL